MAFAAVAAEAGRQGDADQARSAWCTAGSCWRRDDRPEQAARALGNAIALDPSAHSPRARIELAGVCAALGRLEQGQEQISQALDRPVGDSLQALALDTAIGLCLDRGDRTAAEDRLAELQRVAGPDAALSLGFRQAQIARAQGALEEAEQAVREVGEQLRSRGAPALASLGVRSELAEIALLRGDWEDALQLLETASQAAHAGRRIALAWSTEAARLRAQHRAGLHVMPGTLDRGIAYAAGRGLAPLHAELLLTLGMVRGERGVEALDVAIELAQTIGARWIAGRARLQRCQLRQDPVDCERAQQELRAHAPLHSRALLALAQLRDEAEPARRALARFEAYGMCQDAERARTTLSIPESP